MCDGMSGSVSVYMCVCEYEWYVGVQEDVFETSKFEIPVCATPNK